MEEAGQFLKLVYCDKYQKYYSKCEYFHQTKRFLVSSVFQSCCPPFRELVHLHASDHCTTAQDVELHKSINKPHERPKVNFKIANSGLPHIMLWNQLFVRTDSWPQSSFMIQTAKSNHGLHRFNSRVNTRSTFSDEK